MTEVESMSITFKVDNLKFLACINAHGGAYKITGPIWEGQHAGVLCTGRLGAGYAWPSLAEALGNIVKTKLKS